MTRARWLIMAAVVVIVAVVTVGHGGTPQAASAMIEGPPQTTGPVYDGNFPDPSVLVAGGRYYAYATQSGGHNIQVMSSDDLVHWSSPTEALPVEPGWAELGFTWAPAVSPDPAGGYEMFFSARDPVSRVQCVGRATSPSPTGPFVNSGTEPFVCQKFLGGSIDPYVFADHGTDYLIWKSDGANGSAQQLWSQALSADDTVLVGPRSLLLSATSSWENGVVEGPAMLQTPTGLFLYFSGGQWATSDYSIGAVGCDTPLGPCANAPAAQEVSTNSHLIGPGGPSFFVSPDGQTMMAYAAWSGHPTAPGTRRMLYVDTVYTRGTWPTLVEMLVPAHAH